MTSKSEVNEELKGGGEWLAAARRWMQTNINDGDKLCWNDSKHVTVPFCKLEELARTVAVAAIVAERARYKLNKM